MHVPQVTVPPQPSDAVPQFCAPHASDGDFGVQTQSPPMHTAGATHAASSAQLPFVSHFCGRPWLQRFAPGAQALHVMPMQTAGAQFVSPPQCPAASQVCCVVPLRQRFPPGAQSAQTFPMHAPDEHAALAPQLPVPSHVCCDVASPHRVSPGVHVVQSLPLQIPGAHALSLAQCPFASHDCCVPLSLQRVSPGVHSAQALLRHTGGAQTWVSTQLPPIWHVCTLLLVQRFSPGAHSPAQVPSLQTNWHIVSPPQLPFASQTCAEPGACGVQRRELGSQTPAQAGLPEVQTNGHAVPSFAQLPLPSQTCGCLPVQRRAIGVQAEHAPEMHDAAHIMSPPQLPFGSHVCNVFGSPGLH